MDRDGTAHYALTKEVSYLAKRKKRKLCPYTRNPLFVDLFHFFHSTGRCRMPQTTRAGVQKNRAVAALSQAVANPRLDPLDP
jgi:hypothetical protein